jgi:hypothetical protein
MCVSWRKGLMVLALTGALIGCGKSGNPADKPAPSKAGPQNVSTSAAANSSECVVGVEGMIWRNAWTAAVKKAIAALPWVEKDSVSVDYDQKEARFRVKPGEKFDADKLKEAIANSKQGTMGEVKSAPK